MNAKEFFKETTLLALAMTAPPIALLILIKLTQESRILLFVWAVFAVAWTLTVSLLYHKRRRLAWKDN